MLNYTTTALKKITDDIKRLMLIINASIILGSIAYLVHSIIVGAGNVYVTAALCALTAIYFIFFVLKTKKIVKKNEFKSLKRVYRIIKLTVNALILIIAIYGIVTGVESGASAVKTYLLLALWLVQVILELLAIAIERSVKMIKTAFKKDMSALIKVFNVFRKDDIDLPEDDDPYISKLDTLVDEARKEKAAKRNDKIQDFKDKIESMFIKK